MNEHTDLADAIVGTAVAAHETLVAGAVKSGRRTADWRTFFTLRSQMSLFFWLFGMFLDERHKPSMSRVMLAFWTFCGWLLIEHELRLAVGQPSISNACWQSWWAAEGVLCLAVFGPSIASYFGQGAAGAVTGSAIASAVRDATAKIPGLKPSGDDKG